MPRYVAFLRAINVGSHLVRMDHLRTLFEAMGFDRVATFIASGNVIFDSPSKSPSSLEKKISAELERALGYPVATFVRSAGEVAQIAAYEAYKPAQLEEGSLFVVLMPDRLDLRERKTIASMETPVDALRVNQREIYWHASRNFRDAQFSPARLEKLLGKPATFRNVNTMRRIAAILDKP